jgi:predicted transcriptional regulator of viral defense system
MNYSNHIASIAELSESEGVFTTAQAERVGVTRDALHDAVESGRLQRVMRGAYRMVGSGSSYTDELVAVWKLTAPSLFTYERMRFSAWDGIVVGGQTAASLMGIGDFHLSPFRLYAPKRFNTRNRLTRFGKRIVAREDVVFQQGVPVTKMERTISDLILDNEDMSLVADALQDALHASQAFDLEKLAGFLCESQPKNAAHSLYEELLANAGIDGEGS